MIDNSRRGTLVRMEIAKSTTVQVLLIEPQASVTLESRRGVVRVDMMHIREAEQPRLTSPRDESTI